MAVSKYTLTFIRPMLQPAGGFSAHNAGPRSQSAELFQELWAVEDVGWA